MHAYMRWLVVLLSLCGCVQAHDLSHVVAGEADDEGLEDVGSAEGVDDPQAGEMSEEDEGKSTGELPGIEDASEARRALAAMFAVDEECELQSIRSQSGAPNELRCTGLYSDVSKQTLGKRIFEYQPASPLWSDGSDKSRYIYMPKGAKIDVSDMTQWHFPEGVKLFKDFRTSDGRLVETRMFFKKPDGSWAHATYRWDTAQKSAVRDLGGPVEGRELAGHVYTIPTSSECNKCHDGDRESVLGFDAVALGLPMIDGSERRGLDLKQLVEMDMVTPEPEMTELTLGDDGTGLAAPALAFLHTNCGTSCHNGYANSQAQKTQLFFELDPNELDGRSPSGFDAVRTSLGVPSRLEIGAGWLRMVPGVPEESFIVHVMRLRGEKGAMPPLASNVIDEEHVTQVEAWIEALGSGGAADVPAPEIDAGVDELL